MSTSAQPKSSRDKVRKHRERLRAQGLHPIQIWIPDINSKEFREEARRQSLAVSNSPQAKEDQDFIDSISEWNTPAAEEWYKE